MGRVLLFQVELGPQAVDGGEDASEPAPGGGSNVSPDTGGARANRAELLAALRSSRGRNYCLAELVFVVVVV